MKAVKIVVFGDLHKKGFRFYAQKKGIDLGVAGEISHNDGTKSIIIHAEGEEESINSFVEWCSKGTPYCKVTQALVEPAEILGYKYFDVIQENSDSRKKSELISNKAFLVKFKLLVCRLSDLFIRKK